MNPIRLFYFLIHKSVGTKLLTADKPNSRDLFVFYVLPLSLIPCIMIYLRLYSYPKMSMDILPSNLMMVSAELFFFQLIAIVAISWAAKNLARMVSIKPSFRDSLMIVAIAATPLWLMSFFYVVPDLNFSLIIHGVAALASIALIYRGVIYIFGLHRRGAAAMLTMAIVSSASLGFAVILISTLISWDAIQQLQFSMKS